MVLVLYSFSIVFSAMALAFSKIRRDAHFLLRTFPAALC